MGREVGSWCLFGQNLDCLPARIVNFFSRELCVGGQLFTLQGLVATCN